MEKSSKDPSNYAAVDLEGKTPDKIKEKTYITKNVESSIMLLECLENEVVLEALLFLSKYADIQINNRKYIQLHGILPRLLNLFDRNLCILRLSLRLLDILLTVDDTVFEFDQDKYDEKILEILNMYMEHEDSYIKEFAVGILAKMSISCRIAMLIFSVDLFDPIYATLKDSKNEVLIQKTFQLLYGLLDSPAALASLPDIKSFDPPILLAYLHSEIPDVPGIVMELFRKLTYHGIEALQKLFKESKLMEKMFEIVMDPEMELFHKKAIKILENCMNSDITSSYFIESWEFLSFCQWVKTCNPEYMLPFISIFEKLSKNNSIRQTLFDLSVEDSILYFLRSNEKNVLNLTCQAMSNMTVHRFCSERMLTPNVLDVLLEILKRNDDEDPKNEIALKTLFDFSRRNCRTIYMLHSVNGQEIIMKYLMDGSENVTEDSYLRVLEMINKFICNESCRNSVLSEKLYDQVIKEFKKSSDKISLLCLEILTNLLRESEFRQYFLIISGTKLLVDKLKDVTNFELLKSLVIFIHSSLMYKEMTETFMRQNILKALKDLPENTKTSLLLVERTIRLMYNLCLPVKFFETNRLELTDKLHDRFYVINGRWQGNLPFLEVLELMKVSTLNTIYIVNYTRHSHSFEFASDHQHHGSLSFSSNCSSVLVKEQSLTSPPSSRPSITSYGAKLVDPYLPKYISHVYTFIGPVTCMEHKIKILAEYIDMLLSGPCEDDNMAQKFHTFRAHIECLKKKLETNIIPIGYLRIGFHLEKSLLFKALADVACVPCAFVKGPSKLYWNEVAILEEHAGKILRFYVVDLMNDIGKLLPVGSREANDYCNSNYEF